MECSSASWPASSSRARPRRRSAPRWWCSAPPAGEGLSQKTLRTLEEILLTSLPGEELQVLGMSDVRQMLGFEREKQLLGCDNESCITEVAGALGVRFLVASDVGMLGQKYLLNAKVLDARGARVVVRATRTCGSAEELAEKMPELAREVGARLVALARKSAEPRAEPWPITLAVRAGMSGHTGVLGVGAGLQVGRVGVAVGTGTHLLSGGLSLARPGAGPYLDLIAVLARSGPLLLPTSREVVAGVGAGASAGWDVRPVPWLSLKLGVGAAWNSAKEGSPLLLDVAVGYVHRLDGRESP